MISRFTRSIMKYFYSQIIIIWLTFIEIAKCQLSLNILNENESVANWNYCTEQLDCKDQPCHCPFPVIYDSSSEDALNITAQLEKKNV
uniref:Uncharacterized protein n=1 Tax=Panagrolaimus sp. ES5 TaxID=591445 RepID=A0AC34G353_9BILA